ncbi:MAG TPA: response regulator [Candidatus Limnocylindrales bacterium]|nr:response regulator [Candidatus Limnocylindrales bacterium]
MTARTILVVDDHAGFRATARRLLERDGWTVVGEAADGAAALAAVAALAPDVVLLDIGLPDIDGFVVTERLAAGAGDTPAVVLVSSRDLGTYGARVATSSALGFIAKDDLVGGRLRAMVAGAAGR